MPRCSPLKSKLGGCSPRIVSADFLVTDQVLGIAWWHVVPDRACRRLRGSSAPHSPHGPSSQGIEGKGGGGRERRILEALALGALAPAVGSRAPTASCEAVVPAAVRARERAGQLCTLVRWQLCCDTQDSWLSANGLLSRRGAMEEMGRWYKLLQARVQKALWPSSPVLSLAPSRGTRRPKSCSAVAPRCTT